MELKDYVQRELSYRRGLNELAEYIDGSRDAMFGKDAEHWLGPILPKTDPKYRVTTEAIRRNFLVENLLKRVLANHVGALTGKEVDWTIHRGEDTELLEEGKWLKDWYYQQEIQFDLTEALKTLLWARLKDAKGKTSTLLRLYIPQRAIDNGVGLGGIYDALTLGVRHMEIPPEQGGMIRDSDNETVGGFYIWRDEDEQKDYIEITMLASDMRRLKVSMLDADVDPDLTVVQIRSGESYQTIEGEVAYPLGRNLMIYEARREALIYDDTFSQQDANNTEWTYLNRHASASAFMERIILNGMPPGKWVDPETGEESNETGSVYVPGELKVGAGTTNFFSGEEVRNERGEIVGRSNASVAFREPSSSESILANLAAHKQAIYDAVSQLHKLIAGDATSSGVARQQALQDFVLSLVPTENQANFILRWMLVTPLRLAAYMAGQPKIYDDITADPKIQIFVAEPTPDDLRLSIEQFIAGVFDRAELMRRSGIKDTETMIELVKAEMKERAELDAQKTINELDGNVPANNNPSPQAADKLPT